MNKETLKNFAISEDYAYVINAGIMFANDQDVRESIAEMIDAADLIEEAECADLDGEVENGCTIYKVSGNDFAPIYIAYYE